MRISILLLSLAANVYSQSVDWIKSANRSLDLIRYDNAKKQVDFCLFVNDWNFSFADQTISSAYQTACGSFDKTGMLMQFNSTSSPVIPNDFAKSDAGTFICGTKSGRNHFCMSGYDVNGHNIWEECYISKTPQNLGTPYYPNNEAVSMAFNRSSLFITGRYADSIFMGGEWLCNSNCIFGKTNQGNGNFKFIRALPGTPAAKNCLQAIKKDTFLMVQQIRGANNYSNASANVNTFGAALIKLDTSGNVTGANVIGQRIFVSAMMCSGNDVYLAGKLYDGFSGIGQNTFNLPTGSLFVLKCDPSANASWYKIYRFTNGEASVRSLYFANSQLYASGYFTDDSLKLDDTLLSVSGVSNAFLLRFDSSGNQKTLFVINDQQSAGSDLCSDEEGSIYWTGSYSDSVRIADKKIAGGNGFVIRFRDGSNTGITTESYEDDKICLFPNPVSGSLSVESRKLINHMELINQFGSVILQSQENHLDLSGFAKGIYFLRIYTTGSTAFKKLIVE